MVAFVVAERGPRSDLPSTNLNSTDLHNPDLNSAMRFSQTGRAKSLARPQRHNKPRIPAIALEKQFDLWSGHMGRAQRELCPQARYE